MSIKRGTTVIDTANRQRSEKIPQWRAEDFQTIVSKNADAMIVLDNEGYVLYANLAAEGLFSLPSAEMVGAFFGFPVVIDEPVELHILREFKDFIAAEMRMVEVTWAGQSSYLLSFRDLTDRINAAQAMSQAMGKLDAMVAERTRELSEANERLRHEIAERKRTENELLDSERNLAASQEIANIGSYSWDMDEGRITWSDQLYRILGQSPGQAGPSFDTYASFIHPDDRAEAMRKICLAVNEGKPQSNGHRIIWPDGTVRFVQVQSKVLKEKNGKPVAINGIVQDTTERRLAEEALVEAKQQAEMYLDLMGHDISNMHQIALGYLELAREVIQGDEVDKELLDKPVEVLGRSARLISNVHKIRRLQDGVYPSRVIDLGKVLVEIQREFGSVPGKPVRLNMNGRGPCLVRANELLHDVFSNLAANAIKHTGDSAEVTITLGDSVGEGGSPFYRVAVEDNGPGIPDSFKKVIFNRKLKGSITEKGMGIGLYLVKSLVESYDGRVWVEDRVPGEQSAGARFVVVLPKAEEKQTTAASSERMHRGGKVDKSNE